jgi:hypothetical protein
MDEERHVIDICMRKSAQRADARSLVVGRMCFFAIIVFGALGASAGLGAGQSVPERGNAEMNSKVNITLSSAKNEYAVGERIPLTISLKNTGDKPVTIIVRSEWLDHLLTVIDARGNTVPEKPEAVKAKEGAQAGRRAIRTLVPGEILAETIDLEKIFKLSQAGVYRVTSSRHVSEKQTLEDPFLVSSNRLEIRIAQ